MVSIRIQLFTYIPMKLIQSLDTNTEIIFPSMAVRTSKFRHIFGDRNVKSYNGIPISKNAHEQDFCAVNPKFVAVVAEQIGGGAFFVLKTDKIGSVDSSSKISKHNGAVYDIR